MLSPFVDTPQGVTLIGGAPVCPSDLEEALTLAPILVGADGGADRAMAAGRRPDAVIGDLDSIRPATRAALPAESILHIAEQDSTDFEKCLSRIRAPFVLGLGFLGGRMDHALAALSVLPRYSDRPCLLVGAEDVCFLAPRELTLDLTPGVRLSLFPLAELTGESTGLRWPIGGIRFRPEGPSGTSNEVTQPRVALSFSAPAMLVLLPRDCLRAALCAVAPQSVPGG